MKLINFVMKKMNLNSSIDFDDYYQVGTIGLIYASKNYNSNLKISFSTYAYTCIKNEILKYIKSNQNKKYDISLDEQIYDNLILEETIADNSIENAIDTIIIEESNKELYRVLNDELTDDEKIIVKKLYGLGCEQYKQTEVAKKLNIPQYKISRIRDRLFKKVKKYLRNNYH
ncbi:MAG: sigma-70 family RNA polymerase sigma factor [Bacilli bacterium]|nr:sigma-70 family RNA polymerase sigma factor [Bacilli bacterium]